MCSVLVLSFSAHLLCTLSFSISLSELFLHLGLALSQWQHLLCALCQARIRKYRSGLTHMAGYPQTGTSHCELWAQKDAGDGSWKSPEEARIPGNFLHPAKQHLVRE